MANIDLPNLRQSLTTTSTSATDTVPAGETWIIKVMTMKINNATDGGHVNMTQNGLTTTLLQAIGEGLNFWTRSCIGSTLILLAGDVLTVARDNGSDNIILDVRYYILELDF